MSVSRLSKQSIQAGFPKQQTIWDGTTATSSFDCITTVTLPSAQTHIEFNNIPQTYSHLQVRGMVRGNNSAVYGRIDFAINNDLAANYSRALILIDGVNTPGAYSYLNQSTLSAAYIAGNTATANTFGAFIVDILDYANTSKFTTMKSLGGSDNNGAGPYTSVMSGTWLNTAAVTSLKFTTESSGYSMMANSSISLYGIK